MSSMPVFTKPWSPAQNEYRQKFGHACKRAKSMAKDPAIQEQYRKQVHTGQTIYNLVLRDVLRGKLA